MLEMTHFLARGINFLLCERVSSEVQWGGGGVEEMSRRVTL